MAMLVCTLPMKSRRSLAHDIYDNFATHAGLVVTSLLQTAGHKMAAPTVMFLPLSIVTFSQTGREIQ